MSKKTYNFGQNTNNNFFLKFIHNPADFCPKQIDMTVFKRQKTHGHNKIQKTKPPLLSSGC